MHLQPPIHTTMVIFAMTRMGGSCLCGFYPPPSSPPSSLRGLCCAALNRRCCPPWKARGIQIVVHWLVGGGVVRVCAVCGLNFISQTVNSAIIGGNLCHNFCRVVKNPRKGCIMACCTMVSQDFKCRLFSETSFHHVVATLNDIFPHLPRCSQCSAASSPSSA